MKANDVVNKPFRLQFFAENGAESSGGDSQNVGDNNLQNATGESGNNSNDNSDSQNSGDEKFFTQKQVSDMMAKEKKQGKQSILNSLGFKTEQEAKDAVNLLKALQESQKTEEQKQEEAKKAALNEKAEAEARAIKAEAKLTCIENGVNKESVEDVLTIAMSKVTDEKSLEDVISDMKKESRYNSFFETENSAGSEGTGSTPNHSSSQSNNDDNYGKKLAEKFNAKKSVETKSNFF